MNKEEQKYIESLSDKEIVQDPSTRRSHKIGETSLICNL